MDTVNLTDCPLPDLVDGRNVFLREGEVITKARLKDEPNVWYYVSNLNAKYVGGPLGGSKLLFAFVMEKEPTVAVAIQGPGMIRISTWIPDSQLETV